MAKTRVTGNNINMLKVCLIYPSYDNIVQQKIDPPLGLLSIATVIKDKVDVTVLDLIGVESYTIPYADIYGFSICTPAVPKIDSLVIECKKTNPNCKIVVGGVHIAAIKNERYKGVDSYVLSSGETSFLKIIDDYPNIKETYDDYFKFDESSYIDRSFINMEDYKRTVDGLPAMAIQTSRGCPFACSFCSEHLLNNKVQYLKDDIVKKDILDYGYKAFFIYDDIFTLNKKRMSSILNTFKSINAIFDFHARVGSTTKDDLIQIKLSGGNLCRIGIESFSESILKLMNKKVTRQQNIDFIKMVKRVGLKTRIFIIFGFPGETEQTVNETISGIEEADPDQIMMATFIPYPGTDVYNNRNKYGITYINNDYSKFNLSEDNGVGHIIYDSIHTNKNEMYKLQHKLFDYIYSRKMRGELPSYQKRLLKNG